MELEFGSSVFAPLNLFEYEVPVLVTTLLGNSSSAYLFSSCDILTVAQTFSQPLISKVIYSCFMTIELLSVINMLFVATRAKIIGTIQFFNKYIY